VAYHVFVDESVRQSYLLCAVWVDTSVLREARMLLRGLRRSGQRRIHFAKEHPGRRREVLTVALRLGLTVRVYSGKGPALAVRRRCMCALVSDFVDHRVARLVIESGDHEDDVDRQAIYETVAHMPQLGDIPYTHMRSFEEPMLWAADAFAWAYGAGGQWRQMIAKVLTQEGEV
jgi:hypothetical protein